MPRGKFLYPGNVYGKIEILRVESQKTEHCNKKFLCKCLTCGSLFVSSGQDVLKHQDGGCISCRNNIRKNQKNQECIKYIGQTFGNIEVIGYEGIQNLYGRMTPIMKCKCKKCGSECSIPLARLKSGHAKSCKKCGEKNLEIGHEFLKIDATMGTRITAINGKRQLNKNSSSGHTGVSFHKITGKYRAYINFKRKQYYLGTHLAIEDAIKSRK